MMFIRFQIIIRGYAGKMVKKVFFLFLIILLSNLACAVSARLITVSPSDDYRKIEATQAGDIVEIAPGTYSFRVMLKNHGTSENPIVIKAQDPTKRPIWDLHGRNCDEWPGLYST